MRLRCWRQLISGCSEDGWWKVILVGLAMFPGSVVPDRITDHPGYSVSRVQDMIITSGGPCPPGYGEIVRSSNSDVRVLCGDCGSMSAFVHDANGCPPCPECAPSNAKTRPRGEEHSSRCPTASAKERLSSALRISERKLPPTSLPREARQAVGNPKGSTGDASFSPGTVEPERTGPDLPVNIDLQTEHDGINFEDGKDEATTTDQAASLPWSWLAPILFAMCVTIIIGGAYIGIQCRQGRWARQDGDASSGAEEDMTEGNRPRVQPELFQPLLALTPQVLRSQPAPTTHVCLEVGDRSPSTNTALVIDTKSYVNTSCTLSTSCCYPICHCHGDSSVPPPALSARQSDALRGRDDGVPSIAYEADSQEHNAGLNIRDTPNASTIARPCTER